MSDIRILVQTKCETHGIFGVHSSCDEAKDTVLPPDVLVGPVEAYQVVFTDQIWLTPREVVRVAQDA